MPSRVAWDIKPQAPQDHPVGGVHPASRPEDGDATLTSEVHHPKPPAEARPRCSTQDRPALAQTATHRGGMQALMGINAPMIRMSTATLFTVSLFPT